MQTTLLNFVSSHSHYIVIRGMTILMVMNITIYILSMKQL